MKKLILTVSIILLVAAALFLRHKNTISTSEEFFQTNKHLKRVDLKSVKTTDLEPRKSEDFMSGDFKFIPEHLFNVQFEYNFGLDFKAQGKGFKQNLKGELDIFSYGFAQGFVVLHVLPKFRNLFLMPEGPEDVILKKSLLLQPNSFKDGFLIIIDPKGEIVGASSTGQPNLPQLAFTYTLMDQILRPLPQDFQKIGPLIVIEKDQFNRPYEVKYDINKNGKIIDLKVFYESSSSIGGVSKSASAGVSTLGDMNFKTGQTQQAFIKWDDQISLPISQKIVLKGFVENNGTVTDEQSTNAEFTWNHPSTTPLFRALQDVKKELSRSWSLSELKAMSISPVKDGKNSSQTTLSSTFKGLEDLPKLKDSDKEKVFLDLLKDLDQNPELISKFKEKFYQLGQGDRARNMLLGALGFEGSIESQAAMVDVYLNGNASDDEKQKVLNEFALSPYALSSDSKTFLINQYQKNSNPDLSTSSALALGASISKDGDPKTIKFLSQEWDKGRSQEVLLLAMGNSKSNAFMDEVKESLSAKDPVIQQNAVNALRFSQDEESRELLHASLTESDSIDVRLVAAQSIRYQPKDEKTFESISSCSQDDESVVRMECFRTASSFGQDPKYRSLLESAYGTETDPQIKEALRGLIGQ